MTTRDQARRTSVDRADSARSPIEPAPGPSLPERLLAARERKGVDLYRAERDTKIRARYLAALERGDYRELPGAVYTKGFLRNYAQYLGLDPEDVLGQWRRDRGDAAGESVMVVPRPLVAPRQGLVFSPGILVAALLTVVVIAFFGYLAYQLLRFTQPPTLAITDPSTAVSEVDQAATSYTLRGTSIAGASVSVVAAGQGTVRVTADAGGHWAADVDLRRGRNQFDVTAVDPATDQRAPTLTIFITVPFSIVQAPTLTVTSPADGATFSNGAIPVEGSTTDASSVTVSARYEGSPPAPGTSPIPGSSSPGPTATRPSASPLTTRAPSSIAPGSAAPGSAAPGSAAPGSGAPGGSPSPGAPEPVTVNVSSTGGFSIPLQLTEGRWTLTITAASDQGKTTSLTRSVTVTYQGVLVVVRIQGGPAWLKVWVDGKLDSKIGAGGVVLNSGTTRSFRGTTSVEVRTGSSGVTFFTVNGTSVGALGPAGVPQTWLFAPPAAAKQTQHF